MNPRRPSDIRQVKHTSYEMYGKDPDVSWEVWFALLSLSVPKQSRAPPLGRIARVLLGLQRH